MARAAGDRGPASPRLKTGGPFRASGASASRAGRTRSVEPAAARTQRAGGDGQSPHARARRRCRVVSRRRLVGRRGHRRRSHRTRVADRWRAALPGPARRHCPRKAYLADRASRPRWSRAGDRCRQSRRRRHPRARGGRRSPCRLPHRRGERPRSRRVVPHRGVDPRREGLPACVRLSRGGSDVDALRRHDGGGRRRDGSRRRGRRRHRGELGRLGRQAARPRRGRDAPSRADSDDDPVRGGRGRGRARRRGAARPAPREHRRAGREPGRGSHSRGPAGSRHRRTARGGTPLVRQGHRRAQPARARGTRSRRRALRRQDGHIDRGSHRADCRRAGRKEQPDRRLRHRPPSSGRRGSASKPARERRPAASSHDRRGRGARGPAHRGDRGGGIRGVGADRRPAVRVEPWVPRHSRHRRRRLFDNGQRRARGATRPLLAPSYEQRAARAARPRRPAAGHRPGRHDRPPGPARAGSRRRAGRGPR